MKQNKKKNKNKNKNNNIVFTPYYKDITLKTKTIKPASVEFVKIN